MPSWFQIADFQSEIKSVAICTHRQLTSPSFMTRSSGACMRISNTFLWCFSGIMPCINFLSLWKIHYNLNYPAPYWPTSLHYLNLSQVPQLLKKQCKFIANLTSFLHGPKLSDLNVCHPNWIFEVLFYVWKCVALLLGIASINRNKIM